MKKFLVITVLFMVIINVVKLFIPNDITPKVNELHSYCKKNGYNTDYCILVDFSKYSGLDRFYIYSFKENKIVHRSLCAQGHGPYYNIFVKKYSNKHGSNLSSLGKYKVGRFRKMYTPGWFIKDGFEVHGLDRTNSNAHSRGILIHNGNPCFQTFPLPSMPVSHGCFGVSSSMIEHIKELTSKSKKPILLYAYDEK